jgi:flagellar basal-body rod modification protein FlgD
MVGITSALSQNTATGATGAVDTKAAATKMIDSMDQFLLMLTTQLKNQDPLSPMESTEFTNQLVGFAQVEQQIGMNTNLQSLQGLQRQSQQTMALSYLGRYAEIVDNQVELTDSKAKFAYILDNDARTTAITIKNAKGEEVRCRGRCRLMTYRTAR